MRTFKTIFLFLLLFFSFTSYGQLEYDITTITIAEKFNSKNILIARTIRSIGKQKTEDLRVEVVVDPNNMVKALTINDREVMSLMFEEYIFLTDYVINYADADKKAVIPKGNAVTKIVGQNFNDENQLTDSAKKILLDTIKKELMNDKFINKNYDPFDLTLTGNDLFINAKKQEANTFVKYKQLYDRLSDISLSKTTYFQITQTL